MTPGRTAKRWRAISVALDSSFDMLRWWAREFSGASAYDKYLARHGIEHPGHEPLCARDFWRMRDADAERNVKAGCC